MYLIPIFSPLQIIFETYIYKKNVTRWIFYKMEQEDFCLPVVVVVCK